jgi:hypothetical protein
MAGTIIVDRIESDASYASSINVAAQVTFSNTVSFSSATSISSNVGIGSSSPRARVDVNGSIYTSWADTNFIGMQFGSDPSSYRLGILPISSTRDLQIYSKGADGFGVSGITFHTGTGPTERMRIDSSGNMFVGGTAQNTATKPVYSSTTAKAWVSCSIASSTVTVGASFNVSSVTRNGGGDYTINFSSALLDTSYAIAGIASGPGGANAQVAGYNGGGVAVGSYRFYVLNMSNITPTEPNNFYLIFFR